MKHPIFAIPRRGLFLAALVMSLVACGGRQTMASKSAAAYDEAKKNGVPIAAGEHGGHQNEAGHDAGTGMDHGAMTQAGPDPSVSGTHEMTGMDHTAMPGMDHSKMPGMQHGTTASGAHEMAGMDHGAMSGMDHSKMPGMQHGTSATGGHDMAGMDHSAMPGMQHGGSMAGMPGMSHATAKAIAIPPPTTNVAIAQTQPNATLHSDEFDAPSSNAVQESARASSGMNHPMTHDAPAQPQPKPPSPQPPGGHHHGKGEAS